VGKLYKGGIEEITGRLKRDWAKGKGKRHNLINGAIN